MAGQSATTYLEAMQWLLPAFRHEIRGRFNSALLNLEVAGRALDRGDSGKSKAALERARNENQLMSSELPLFLSWFSSTGACNDKTCNQWRREIEALVKPAFQRAELGVVTFDIDDGCRDRLLSAVQARRLLVLLAGLGSVLEKRESTGHGLCVEAINKEASIHVRLTSNPAIDSTLLSEVMAWLDADSQVEHNGSELEIELAFSPAQATP